MTPTKNRLRLVYKDLPDLQALAGGLAPGDRFTLEVSLMVVSNDDTAIEGDMEEISVEMPENEDSEGAKSVTATPTSEEPVMVEVVRMTNKSKVKSASPVEPETKDEEDV